MASESMIDWANPMASFGFTAETVDDDDDNDNDDFYGTGATTTEQASVPAPAPAPQSTPRTISAEAKAENQRRAELLRAKLLAQRQNTPSSGKIISRSNTPAKATSKSAETPSSPPTRLVPQPGVTGQSKDQSTLEALLTKGKAMADAKTASLAVESSADPTQSNTQKEPAIVAQTNGASSQRENLAQVETTQPSNKAHPQPVHRLSEPSTHPSKLSDEYYADLPAWLEMTGYHDVVFRNSKLRTYKERKALEEEAARIAVKLEQLRQAEQETIQSRRLATPSVNSHMAPPPLPVAIPVQTPHTNGVKRSHSPDFVITDKIRCREGSSGFRIRGANESPEARPGMERRPRTPSPDFERRGSYQDVRRRSSVDEHKDRSRDPSLERRQSYYRREADSARYDHYTPREAPRPGFGNASRTNSRPKQRGSAGLDLRKGGVRYFMIKSWNHENVIASQRDRVWATQEKNEEMLTQAFKTSRHVILLFSVNKSVAFQGCALMTSAPDPTLPKPRFCQKLNWGTSSAFTLRWLSTTPIPFRLIGHLRNTMKMDVNGEPCPVLVGKDGQEISPDAGMGVVQSLDEAETDAMSNDSR